jgi:N-acetylneuraminic acid mutarotase
MYLFGGWDGEDAVDSVWIYEPISGDWEKGAKMQIASQHASAVMLTNEIVVLGGHSGDKRISSVYAFYPSRDNLDD